MPLPNQANARHGITAIAVGRTELHGLAAREAKRVQQMAKLYREWAEMAGVLPWPVVPKVIASAHRGKNIHIVR